MVSDRPFPAIQEDNQDTRTVEVEEDLQDVFDSLLKVSTHMRRILMKLKRIKEKSPSLMTFDHPGVFTRTTSGSDFEWRLSARLLQAPDDEDDCDGSRSSRVTWCREGPREANWLVLLRMLPRHEI